MPEAADSKVIVDLGVVLGDSGAAAPVDFESGPTRLTGGRSADLFRFRLSDGPPDLIDRDLVLRLLPRATGSIAECVIQDRVAHLGHLAPEVVRSGFLEDARPYLIMRHVDGTSLFQSQGPLRALRRVPGRLATLMLALHLVDPAPVRRALSDVGADAAQDVQQRALAQIDTCFAAVFHPAHDELRRWLDQHRPSRSREVVCHGDLHALNVLVDGDATAVIDWELAGLGDPAFDVARTKLLLHAVPMELPRAARPIVQRLGRRAAAQFEGAYVSKSAIDPATLRWHEALHTARMIGLVLAHGSVRGPTEDVVDGWRPTLPLLVSSLSTLSGISLTH